MRTIVFLILVFFLFLLKTSSAQSIEMNVSLHDTLNQMCRNIWKNQADSNRLNANELFFNAFGNILKNYPQISYLYDSLDGITGIRTMDNRIKIYTWNIPLTDGTSIYNGYILQENGGFKVTPLKSSVYSNSDFLTRRFTSSNWYGAIFYALIEKEVNGQKIITLLGWDGKDKSSNRKLIDVMTINEWGEIGFGMPVFKTENGLQQRVVLEYAENANVMLRYDYQSVILPVKKRLKRISDWLIVFDHLVPLNQSVQGLRKFYVPSGETYDGYWFRDGYWVLVENLEILDKTN